MQPISLNTYISSIKNNKPINRKTPVLPQKTPLKDTVELNTKENNKKNINKQKIVQLAKYGAILATLAFLALSTNKAKDKQLSKFIEFKKAENIEEGYLFAKDNFNIKDFWGFHEDDLEILNWINEGMCNLSNKLKGKIHVPKLIYLESNSESETTAYVAKNLKFIAGDALVFNKEYHKNIDKELSNYILSALGKKLLIPASYNDVLSYKTQTFFDAPEIDELFKKRSKTGLTFKEKLELTNAIKSLEDYNTLIKVTQYQKKEVPTIKPKIVSAFNTIFHEFGHLQDKIKRCPAMSNFSEAIEYPKELNQWLYTKGNLTTAQKVSNYAKEGPGEFIAEVYMQALNGNKFDDDIIELYNKLKGPELPIV